MKLFLLLFSYLCFADAQCLTTNDNPLTSNYDARNLLIDGRFQFSLNTLKIIANIKQGENIFFSPVSLYEALTLVYFGSRGSTEDLLKQALGIPEDFSKIDVQRFFSFESNDNGKKEETSSLPSVEYNVANRLWVKNSTKIRMCMSAIFNHEIKKVDFRSNPESARNEINNWVKNITKGNIPELLPFQSITEDTDLVLTNAVYFKGQWKSRFNPENTKKDIFYPTENNATFENFMRQKGTFNHTISEVLGAHVLQLPYKDDNTSMFIFLPPFAAASGIEKPDGLYQLLVKMTTNGSKELHEILDGEMKPKSVDVQIPKFTFEEELPVIQVAQELGIGQILVPGEANLLGFVEDGEESLHIGDAVHHAKIEITEEGTTAAAATAVFSFRSSRPTGPVVFHANHPFLYIIYHHASRSILFSGIFSKPTK
ncbi:serine protease inhibitor 88Ea-like [Leptopilina boulardi]|uniref:serine protease inhibitor 88Ea-like n=1 Tax=Leptopilina boulardi TaxID=63433 RepID=UPI0021F5EB10|nr:serine protease inhibitor 88Ea-like [Leptopilina boulardi]XP_051158219.1 serine protease inhibitor 88Ea-like [Leptopilina boulardi]